MESIGTSFFSFPSKTNLLTANNLFTKDLFYNNNNIDNGNDFNKFKQPGLFTYYLDQKQFDSNNDDNNRIAEGSSSNTGTATSTLMTRLSSSSSSSRNFNSDVATQENLIIDDITFRRPDPCLALDNLITSSTTTNNTTILFDPFKDNDYDDTFDFPFKDEDFGTTVAQLYNININNNNNNNNHHHTTSPRVSPKFFFGTSKFDPFKDDVIDNNTTKPNGIIFDRPLNDEVANDDISSTNVTAVHLNNNNELSSSFSSSTHHISPKDNTLDPFSEPTAALDRNKDDTSLQSININVNNNQSASSNVNDKYSGDISHLNQLNNNSQSIINSSSLNNELPLTPLCKYFQRGYCAKGDRCQYLHKFESYSSSVNYNKINNGNGKNLGYTSSSSSSPSSSSSNHFPASSQQQLNSYVNHQFYPTINNTLSLLNQTTNNSYNSSSVINNNNSNLAA